MDRGRRARSTTSGTWTSGASAATTAASATRSPARSRSTRPTTTSSTRARSARRGGRCASRRPIRRLRDLGAAFGEKSGWERANWFESNAARGDEALRPRGWAGENWSPAIGAECLATGEAAGIFDQSSFSKIDVHGPGAAAFLERLCANAVDRPPGTVVYTQLLNRRGGIEADLTVTRLAADRFQLVTGTAFGAHDLGWIRRHLPGDGSVYADDITSARACFCVWGPASRAILQALTKTDLSHAAFPYMRARELALGSVPCLALRVTYVGELGFEVYCPSEFGAALWDALWEAGAPHGLTAAGYRAIDSMRLEKGYRAWGSDITPETTPASAGLGFAVREGRAAPFIGEDAVRAEREAGGPPEKLVCIVLADPRSVCLGSEPVRFEGEVCGRVTSGGYGYRVARASRSPTCPRAGPPSGRAVRSRSSASGSTGEVAAEPLYDPEGVRIRS